MTLEERVAGALWGLAWGDVLGAPIESWSEAEIAAAYGRYEGLPLAYPADVPAKKKGRLRPFGVHTDDTQQALALVNVCLAPGGFTVAAWAKALVDGARAQPSGAPAWRGTGKQFDGAVDKLAKGAAPQQSGAPSAGIGAAMRAAPLGALYRDQSRKLAEVALESSAVTHADLRAIALSYAVAWSTAQLVNGVDVADVRVRLPDAVAEAEDEWLFGKAQWSLERGGRHQLSLALARLLASATRTASDLGGLADECVRLALPFVDKAHLPAHPNHAFALLGGLHGLVAGLLDDIDPAGVLLRVVQLGEDTDTVAAIAGGVLGARFGTAWIPKDRVVDHARIALYAQALVRRTLPPEPLAKCLAREGELTALEKRFQAAPAAAPTGGDPP